VQTLTAHIHKNEHHAPISENEKQTSTINIVSC
jgi:hypothetical protein